MALSYAALLDLAKEAYERRLRGDAFDEYNDADKRFRGTPTDKILDQIVKLETLAASQSSSGGARYVRTANP